MRVSGIKWQTWAKKMKRVCVGLVLGMMFCAGSLFAGEIPFEAEVVITAEELSAMQAWARLTRRSSRLILRGI